MNISLNASFILFNKVHIASEILAFYIIPTSAAFAFILNFLYGLLLSQTNLPNRKYKLIFLKTIIKSLITLTLIGYRNYDCTYCIDRLYNTHFFQIYSLYVFRWPGAVLWFCLSFIELLITLEMNCILNKKTNFIIKTSLKYICSLILAVSICFWVPDFNAYIILYDNTTRSYLFTMTNFGKSNFYNTYIIALATTQYGFLLGILIFLNFKNFKIYNKLANLKLDAPDFIRKKISKIEIKFTKAIIIETCFFIANMFFTLISVILKRLYSGSVRMDPIQNIFRNISFEINILAYIIDIFVYLSLDSKLQKKLIDKLKS